ncbi:Hypothetical predicted protein [Cloeon dipterum]|uniref:S-methyl-5'-thioadenosine phosphorylase n=1 Tax=Cloeon dipterum TaxID=197152 RepID=A0A8S1DM72_9INSE|nr:Hypothetical predicted protein [Cloeon dipterum]
MGKYKIKIGIIGGSGLDDPDILDNRAERKVTTPFGDPSDILIEGTIGGQECVLLARHGRRHTIMPSAVNFRANIWALKEAGCTHILASTATGSLREDIVPGDLVVLNDFIDRTTKRAQSFFDGTLEEGVCHLPMYPAFCEETRMAVIKALTALGFKHHTKGTCVSIEGPRFSSRAESNMFRSWGADVINMTTCPEVVLAKEAGICYAAVAMATDYDCWRDHGDSVSVSDVLATFKKNAEKVTALFKDIVPAIGSMGHWDDIIDNLRGTVNGNIMKPSH